MQRNPITSQLILNTWRRMVNSRLVKGSLMLLLASLSLSLQNVFVRIIFSQQTVLGSFRIGGFISLGIGNSLLILFMRVLFIVLFTAFLVGPFLHRALWQDMLKLFKPSNRALLGKVLGSGFLLFLSQIAMYFSLSSISAGVATTIFFIYPTITILLTWLIFGNRPTVILGLAVITIYSGCLLVIPNAEGVESNSTLLGVFTAALAGVAFAAYAVMAQICSQKHNAHPVSFTLATFTEILILNTLSLGAINFIPELTELIPALQIQVSPDMWSSLWQSTFALSLTSIVGFLFTNFGIAAIGATLASIVGATGPVLTTAIAWLLIQEALQGKHQLIGIFLVTLWVTAISSGSLNSGASAEESA
ncbi:DMT family transporter [Pseudanabaena sp. FACHB-2040]|uniref:DMT family transporter n=1 Tax=Pseudanabaena sp. FACHB-2040 TaxID=2692859 RepID=UPI00168532F8|nr:DMT family transporter [Pseudanabaena sp. FACHB-2040]MBD2258210.1 DMT family transporter [Pseudanabaena sp. FACHB-2040]